MSGRPYTFESLMAKVEPEPNTGCWIWTGYRDRNGYGRCRRLALASTALPHRIVYEHERGPIPAGLELDHRCRNPWCVNPDHLRPVTHLENLRNSSVATRTECPFGHALTPANTHYKKHRSGAMHRTCGACIKSRAFQSKFMSHYGKYYGPYAELQRIATTMRQVRGLCFGAYVAQLMIENDAKHLRAEGAATEGSAS